MIPYDFSLDAVIHPERMETLFQPDKPCSDIALAAECARLAYIRHEDGTAQRTRLTDALGRVGFGEVQVFRDVATDTEAFAAIRADGVMVIAFRGTEPDRLRSIITDAKFRLDRVDGFPGKVHTGFAQAARAIHPQVQAWLDVWKGRRTRLIVCGHSLGAAIATLLAPGWRADLLVTVGSPRVGDEAYVADVTRAGSVARTIRLACGVDQVARVPVGFSVGFSISWPLVRAVHYAHIGELHYIDRHGVMHVSPDAAFVAQDQASVLPNFLTINPLDLRNAPLRALSDHAPVNYLRALGF